jgi:hypothetical protein
MPVVEQDMSAQMDTGNQVDKTNAIESSNTPNFSQATNVEDQLGRNPYGYTGSLSGECEIPWDVLKYIYETFDDDCENGDECSDDMAMVFEQKDEDGIAMHDKDCDASIGDSDDTQLAVWGSPQKKKRRIEIDTVDTEDKDK